MRMQVILDSSFARPGSAPIWSGKKGEFRDWTTLYENISNFNTRLRARGYSHNLKEKINFKVKFTERKSALQQTAKVWKKILPFLTRYHPALPNLKNILMSE